MSTVASSTADLSEQIDPSAATVEELASATSKSEADQPQKKRQRLGRGSSPAPTSCQSTGSNSQSLVCSPAFLAVASQAAGAAGLTCLTNLLATGTIPSIEQVKATATKTNFHDSPPFVHLSKADSAPQLKVEHFTLRGGMRGYRMSRASHGVNEGTYYYEVLVQDPPPIDEIVASLPSNVRLAKKLQKQLEEEMQRQKTIQHGKDEKRPTVGGHLRLGWSMRTGDLQAPVGYDKWSFAIRDIGGSRIHSSMREDEWGGEGFGPGDVIGVCISLPMSGSGLDEERQSENRHIRFFKNGDALGNFEISKGKRRGGAAFTGIPEGVYYPAISSYLGGSCKVNFGPHFYHPPRMLPTGMKMKPLSDIVPDPKPVEEVVQSIKLPKKTDEAILSAFRDVVRTEASIRFEAHRLQRKRHEEEVRAVREQRGLSTGDLPLFEATNDADMLSA